MSKWIDFSLKERKAMIQGVVEARQIDEVAAEKDWWVTTVLYALFHTSVSEYLLFKGGTSLSKGWDIINRFSEDIDLVLSRDYFLNVKNFPVQTALAIHKSIISARKDKTFCSESSKTSWKRNWQSLDLT